MVTDEALIAETAVWPNFFLMNIFFALKGSKLFIIVCNIKMKLFDNKKICCLFVVVFLKISPICQLMNQWTCANKVITVI